MKKFIIIFVSIVAAFLVYVAFLPSDMNVSRELVVNATPEALFPYINNSKKSSEWMPWLEIDPKVQMTYSGPEEGLGSTSSWESTGQMGTGQAVVVESTVNQSVKTKLTYIKPMEMSQMAQVSLTPSVNGTLVRWSVTGQNAFMGKLMGVIIDMDKMIGLQFEKGLTNLKNKVEGKK